MQEDLTNHRETHVEHTWTLRKRRSIKFMIERGEECPLCEDRRVNYEHTRSLQDLIWQQALEHWKGSTEPGSTSTSTKYHLAISITGAARHGGQILSRTRENHGCLSLIPGQYQTHAKSSSNFTLFISLKAASTHVAPSFQQTTESMQTCMLAFHT
jgi:hypothetical protein